MTAPPASPEFTLPSRRIAISPPEARGLGRDEVRLLVASPNRMAHSRFRELGRHLQPGDLLVVNSSRTMPAAVVGSKHGSPVVVHLSTPHPDGSWSIELRRPDQRGPFLDARPGERVDLVGGASVLLVGSADEGTSSIGVRLWQASITFPKPVMRYLRRFGRPIRYSYMERPWPLRFYQTVFADRCLTEFASAEMPSAGRPFTTELLETLRRRGVEVAPVLLHAGVSSLESGEPPAPERYEVSQCTARKVNQARREGRRVIAVGTGATRALETVGTDDGLVDAGIGWTELVLGPDRPARVVDGLITGWHPPGASHLSLLESVAGAARVDAAYRAALDGEYLWHEFGDSCLLLAEQR